MEKLLFLMAMVMIFMALVSRRHLHKEMEDDSSEEVVIEQNLSADKNQPNSLAYAINKISPEMAKSNAPVGNQPVVPVKPGAIPGATPGAEQMARYLSDIKANNEQSVYALERALNETSRADQASQRLTLYQAALNIASNDANAYKLKDLTMREMTANVVPPVSNSLNLTPDELARIETNRMIVGTAFKIYLNTTKSSAEALQDTTTVLNFQQDAVMHELLVFDCVSRYPDLREKLGEN